MKKLKPFLIALDLPVSLLISLPIMAEIFMPMVNVFTIKATDVAALAAKYSCAEVPKT